MDIEVLLEAPFLDYTQEAPLREAWTQNIISVNVGTHSLRLKVFSGVPGNEVKELFSAEALDLYTTSAALQMRSEDHRWNETLEEDTSLQHVFVTILKCIRQNANLIGIESLDDIYAICHKIPYGGTLRCHKVLTKSNSDIFEELMREWPIQNGPPLALVKKSFLEIPKAKNVLFFDTSFHQDIPDLRRRYDTNLSFYNAQNLRRDGAHGISYSYAHRKAAEYLGIHTLERMHMIAFHLGTTTSACTVFDGKSKDCSEGLMPFEGLTSAYGNGRLDLLMKFSGVKEFEPININDPIKKLVSPGILSFFTTLYQTFVSR